MAENKYITVAYKMYVKEDGDEQEELAEMCDSTHPFQFLSGFGMVIPAFEQNIENVAAGSTFDFVIPCADAYGEFLDELMFDVPRNIFEIDGKLDSHIKEGAVVPMQGEDGSRFNATIIEIMKDAVTIDLNHPRAGQDLHFVGEVVTNRPATNEEITEIMNAMSGEGCGGCGGGCGHCGGGCGGDGGCEGGGCGCH